MKSVEKPTKATDKLSKTTDKPSKPVEKPTKIADRSVKAVEKPVSDKLKAAADAKKSRKRAADFIEEDVKEVEEKPVKEKKVKKFRISEVVTEEPIPTSISKAKPKGKSGEKKKGSKSEEASKIAAVVDEEFVGVPSDDEEDVAAMLAGFSSDEDVSEGEGEEGLTLDQIPQPKLSKKAKKDLAAAKLAGNDVPGTLYIG